jgi:hypothetical protein
MHRGRTQVHEYVLLRRFVRVGIGIGIGIGLGFDSDPEDHRELVLFSKQLSTVANSGDRRRIA